MFYISARKLQVKNVDGYDWDPCNYNSEELSRARFGVSFEDLRSLCNDFCKAVSISQNYVLNSDIYNVLYLQTDCELFDFENFGDNTVELYLSFFNKIVADKSASENVKTGDVLTVDQKTTDLNTPPPPAVPYPITQKVTTSPALPVTTPPALPVTPSPVVTPDTSATPSPIISPIKTRRTRSSRGKKRKNLFL